MNQTCLFSSVKCLCYIMFHHCPWVNFRVGLIFMVVICGRVGTKPNLNNHMENPFFAGFFGALSAY